MTVLVSDILVSTVAGNAVTREEFKRILHSHPSAKFMRQVSLVSLEVYDMKWLPAEFLDTFHDVRLSQKLTNVLAVALWQGEIDLMFRMFDVDRDGFLEVLFLSSPLERSVICWFIILHLSHISVCR
jgi:hypothetical protein